MMLSCVRLIHCVFYSSACVTIGVTSLTLMLRVCTKAEKGVFVLKTDIALLGILKRHYRIKSLVLF